MSQIRFSANNIFHDNAAAYGVDKSIMKGRATESVTLFGYELIDDSLSFTAFLQTMKSNPGIIVPPGLTATLYDGDGAYIRAKRFGKSYTADFGTGFVNYEYQSVIGRLDSMSPHNGGLYKGNKTVGDVLAEIFDGFSLATVTVAQSVANILLYGRLKRASRRNNLAEILIATGAALTYDSSGNIIIGFLGTSPINNIDLSYSGSVSIECRETYKSVEVTEHGFYELPGDEVKTLFDNTDSLPSASSVLVEFQDPCYDLQTTGTLTIDQISGQDDANCNYAVVSGIGTLTGKVYTHTTKIISQTASNSGVAVRTLDDVQIVTLVNSQYVAQRMANFYKRNEYVNFETVLNADIKPGARVRFGTGISLLSYTGYIESLNYNLNPRKTRASVKLLTGWMPGPFGSNITTFELLTGSGTWTKPANLVGDVTAILIGGGKGGTGGQGGQGGTGSDNRTVTAGGVGGSKGQGGTGGKVLQVTFSPTGSISYSCGTGGVGGTGGAKGYTDLNNVHHPAEAGAVGDLGTDGADGTDTTFGSYSSATGSVMAQGIQNILNGEIYALPGNDGPYAGADGGDSGEPGNDVPAQAGGDVDGYIGGVGGTNAINEPRARGAGGGGGGGAANGANGASGQNGSILDNPPWTETPGKGGDGADASLIPSVGNIGQGGAGGCGGGGGGASGANYNNDGTGYAGADGGNGSDGQKGFDGGILLLYTVNSQS